MMWWTSITSALRARPATPQVVEIPTHALEMGKVYVLLVQRGSLQRSVIRQLGALYPRLGVRIIVLETHYPHGVRFVEVERPSKEAVE